jgi:low affinity Fe/Cu permease
LVAFLIYGLTLTVNIRIIISTMLLILLLKGVDNMIDVNELLEEAIRETEI